MEESRGHFAQRNGRRVTAATSVPSRFETEMFFHKFVIEGVAWTQHPIGGKRASRSCSTEFSNRHCQQLTSLRFVTRAGLQGSLRGRRAGRRMLAFKVG